MGNGKSYGVRMYKRGSVYLYIYLEAVAFAHFFWLISSRCCSFCSDLAVYSHALRMSRLAKSMQSVR